MFARFLATALPLMLLLCGGPIARADEESDRAAKAKLHYETGMAHFNLEEWDQAIEEWQAGYRNKPLPEFMYNIAQAYRKSKRPERALQFYKSYLRLEPNAPNKDEVERHIVEANQDIEQQKKAGATRPPNTQPSQPQQSPSAGAQSNTLVTQAPKRHQPVYKKWWLWTIVGVAVVGAGVGIGLGVAHANTVSYPTGSSSDGTFRFP